MPKFKKIAITVVLFVAAGLIGKAVGHFAAASHTLSKSEVIQGFEKEIATTKFPVIVDDRTSIIATRLEENKTVYAFDYSLTQNEKWQFGAGDIANIKSHMKATSCNNKNIREVLSKNILRAYRLNFYDRNHALITSFDLTANSCSH